MMSFWVLATEANELFELGGGPWGGFKDRGGNPDLDYHELALNLVDFKSDQEAFANHFLACWESGYIEGRGDPESQEYMRAVGRRLWVWCDERNWLVKLVTDHDAQDYTMCVETGTRYEED